MHDDISAHIALAAKPSACQGLAWRLFFACWPGGSLDQTQTIARLWFGDWRPAEIATEFRTCGCASGHCLVCN